jgi:hypothetical protein
MHTLNYKNNLLKIVKLKKKLNKIIKRIVKMLRKYKCIENVGS